MNLEILQHSSLKNGQQKAFFSYGTLLKGSKLQLDALCKTCSAMANAIGGNIYIGLIIEKSKFKAWEDKPHLFPSKGTLLNLIHEQIQPKIKGLEIEDVENGLLIKIPESRLKPHIANNYKYYKRVLSRNQVMEEFEIRQLYQASSKSDLKILNLSKLQGIPLLNAGKFEEMKFYPQIHIQNLGQRIEKNYKLEVAIPSALVDENFTVLHRYLKGYDLNKNIYSIPNTEALFQSETKTIIELVLKVNSKNYKSFLESSIHLKLYSTEGVHEQSYRLCDWLHYKGELPPLESFVKKLEE